MLISAVTCPVSAQKGDKLPQRSHILKNKLIVHAIPDHKAALLGTHKFHPGLFNRSPRPDVLRSAPRGHAGNALVLRQIRQHRFQRLSRIAQTPAIPRDAEPDLDPVISASSGRYLRRIIRSVRSSVVPCTPASAAETLCESAFSGDAFSGDASSFSSNNIPLIQILCSFIS